MARGVVLALALFAGIGAALAVGHFGVQNIFLKAAAFAVAFVLIFGGYSWTRKPHSAPPAT